MKYLNLGIVAHVDAGKTTLTEDILYQLGLIKQKGSVNTQNTVTDDLSMEKARGITIKERTVSFIYDGIKINLLDTPGHMDFFNEVARACRVLDLAVLVISANDGVQPQTVSIVKTLQRLQIPVVVLVNKVDQLSSYSINNLRPITELLSKPAIEMQQLVVKAKRRYHICAWQDNEGVFNRNLEYMIDLAPAYVQAYFDQQNINRLNDGICYVIKQNLAVPVYYGVAIDGIGTHALLDGLKLWAIDTKSCVNGALSAVIYKVIFPSAGVSHSYVRMYRGKLNIRDKVCINGSDVHYKINHLYAMNGGKLERTESIEAGDIGIITNLDGIKVGDVLGDWSNDIITVILEQPTIQTSINCQPASERSKLLDALFEMEVSDHQLGVIIDAATSEIKIRICGSVQKDFIKQQLKEQYDLNAKLCNPVQILKETPKTSATYMIGLSSKDNHYSAGIEFTIKPLPRGTGVRYVSEVSYGYITQSFQNAVREGAINALSIGLKGWELTDIEIKFISAQFDSVMSTPSDYRNLASVVLKKALMQSDTVLLYPKTHYTAIFDSIYFGKVFAMLSKYGAEISDTAIKGNQSVIKFVIVTEKSERIEVLFLRHTENRGWLERLALVYE